MNYQSNYNYNQFKNVQSKLTSELNSNYNLLYQQCDLNNNNNLSGVCENPDLETRALKPIPAITPQTNL